MRFSKRPDTLDFNRLHTGPNTGLKNALDGLYRQYSSTWIDTDPISIPHRFSRKEDIEIAGLIASSLSYGKVSLFKPVIESLIAAIGPSPHEYLSRMKPGKSPPLKNLYYRFQTSEDLERFLGAISRAIQKHGSLGRLFLEGYSQTDENILPALEKFALSLRGFLALKNRPVGHGLSHLIPSPGNGAMKRLNMFLRWMVRKDAVDFGIWPEIPAAKLIIPLDTHIHRISRYLGLVRRKNAGILSAIEITNSLKIFSGDDPVKYDFALTRIGMYGCSLPGKTACVICNLAPYCLNASG